MLPLAWARKVHREAERDLIQGTSGGHQEEERPEDLSATTTVEDTQMSHRFAKMVLEHRGSWAFLSNRRVAQTHTETPLHAVVSAVVDPSDHQEHYEQMVLLTRTQKHSEDELDHCPVATQMSFGVESLQAY